MSNAHSVLVGLAAAIVAAPAPAQPAPTSRIPRDTFTLPVARRALALPGFRWLRRSSRHADLYVLAGSAAESLLPALDASVERAIAADLRWLGKTSTNARFHLFFVGSRDEMRPLTGSAVRGWSEPVEGTAFFAGNDSAPPALRHELMHLLSWRLWGTPAAEWLSEGVATAGVGGCAGHAIDDVAAAIAQAHELVPFDTLRAGFAEHGSARTIEYVESASVIQFIDRHYGRKRLRAFWSSGRFDHTRRTLGADAATIERQWRGELAGRNPTATWSEMGKEIGAASGCEMVDRR